MILKQFEGQIHERQFENELDEIELQTTTALPGVGPVIPEDVPILPVIASQEKFIREFSRIL